MDIAPEAEVCRGNHVRHVRHCICMLPGDVGVFRVLFQQKVHPQTNRPFISCLVCQMQSPFVPFLASSGKRQVDVES